MAVKFKFGVAINPHAFLKTARLGDGPTTSNPLKKEDNDKFVKLVGDSQYGLAALGEEIEGFIQAADNIAPQDGFYMGTICDDRGTRVVVAFDGAQGTPGTGAVAIGDYVVAGAPVARGTSLGSAFPKVLKATTPSGLTYKWRVVSFKSGTGAVGQTGVIERV